MALQCDLQVILQTEISQAGDVQCEGFNNLPIVHPVYIGIATDRTSRALANARILRREIIIALHQLGPQVQSPKPPCKGFRQSLGRCHAFQEPACRKLLVLIGDGNTRISVGSKLQQELRQYGHAHILPILPKGTDPTIALPTDLHRINCEFWSNSVREAVPAVLSTVGIVSNDYRIFVSYRQNESTSLAEQIFDALCHEGFDVFLDRFRVPPAIDFQRRLTQELEDKSMVLLLESSGILSSQWTIFEIIFALTHRLGLAAINLPGGIQVPGIPRSMRRNLRSRDLDSGGRISTAKLQSLVEFIKRQHGLALVRRRAVMRRNLSDSLLYARITNHRVSANGLIQVGSVSGNPLKDYAVWLTLRPPNISDFHLTDSHLLPGSKGVVVGPARYLESERKAQIDWLSQTSDIACVDEGNLLAAVRDIAQGTL